MWRKANCSAERRAAAGRFLPAAQEDQIMQRTLLTLALVAAAGIAVAQTTSPPAVGGGSATTPSATGPSVTAPSVSTPSGDANTANPTHRLNGQAGDAPKPVEADGYKNVQARSPWTAGLWAGHAELG